MEPKDLTKREYFALHILQGLLAHPDCSSDANKVINSAVEGADHLIAELNKQDTKSPPEKPKSPLYDPMYA